MEKKVTSVQLVAWCDCFPDRVSKQEKVGGNTVDYYYSDNSLQHLIGVVDWTEETCVLVVPEDH